MDAFLAGLPGVGMLTDAQHGSLVWSHRWNMPSLPGGRLSEIRRSLDRHSGDPEPQRSPANVVTACQ
jgi:hypothetical protein